MSNFSLNSIQKLTKANKVCENKDFINVQKKIEDAAKLGKNYCLYFCNEYTFDTLYNKLKNMGFKVTDFSDKYPARVAEYKTLGIDW